MRKLLLITFLLFSSLAFSQLSKTEKVKDASKSETLIETDCVCTCHKEYKKYDELVRAKELYMSSVISLKEHKKIRKAILKSLKKRDLD